MTNLKIYTQKLRESGLRPTRQRLKICEVLFSPEKTFHFTINDLTKIIEEKLSEKISLATVYNTIHAFEKKGIFPFETRDEFGGDRYMPFLPGHHF